MTNDTVHFNVYCTTIKQQQQSTRYSKTVLYNDSNTVNTSITGLLPNTTYTCCVLAVTSYGESEPVCQNNITTPTKTISNARCKYMMYYYCVLFIYPMFTSKLLPNDYICDLFAMQVVYVLIYPVLL